MSTPQSRACLKQGWLEKKSGRLSKWKRRWAVLSKHRLFLFSTQDTDSEPRDTLDLTSYRSAKWSSSSKPLTLELCSRSGSHKCALRAESKACAKQWVECLFAVAQSIRELQVVASGAAAFYIKVPISVLGDAQHAHLSAEHCVMTPYSRKRDVSWLVERAVAAIEKANEAVFVKDVFEVDGFAKRLSTRGLRWDEPVTSYAKQLLMRKGVHIEACWRCDACAALTRLGEVRCAACAAPKPRTLRVPVTVSRFGWALRGEKFEVKISRSQAMTVGRLLAKATRRLNALFGARNARTNYIYYVKADSFCGGDVHVEADAAKWAALSAQGLERFDAAHVERAGLVVYVSDTFRHFVGDAQDIGCEHVRAASRKALLLRDVVDAHAPSFAAWCAHNEFDSEALLCAYHGAASEDARIGECAVVAVKAMLDAVSPRLQRQVLGSGDCAYARCHALQCPSYFAVRIEYRFSAEHLRHLRNETHFADVRSKPRCRHGQECRAFLRLADGTSALQARFYISHPKSACRQRPCV